MQKTFSLKAKNVVAYIAFAMMALVSTSAKADEEVDFRSIATEINGSCTINVSYSSSASNYSNGYCWYKFTAPSSGTFTLYSSGNEDTYAVLYDAKTQLDYNDDSGSDYNFKLEYEDTENATYYLGVKKYSNEAGNFSVTFRFPCPHTNIQHVASKAAATCKEQGNIEYYKCQDCEAYFSDSKRENEIGKEDIITYGNHSLQFIASKEPVSCMEPGIIEHYKCKYCGGCFSDNKALVPLITNIDRAFHSYNAEDICTSCGMNRSNDDYLAFTALYEDVDMRIEPNIPFSKVVTGVGFKPIGYGDYDVSYSFEYSFDKENWVSISGNMLAEDGKKYLDMINGVLTWAINWFNDGHCGCSKALATIPKGKTLYLRQTGNGVTSLNKDVVGEYGYDSEDSGAWGVSKDFIGWYFTASAPLKVSGNVMSLLTKNLSNESAAGTFNGAFIEFPEGSMFNVKTTATKAKSDDTYANMMPYGVFYSPSGYYKVNDNVESRNISLLYSDDLTASGIETKINNSNADMAKYYTRDIKANWNTICLPFAANSSADTKFYVIDNLENGVITLKLANTLAAGTPALVYTTNNYLLDITGSGAIVSTPVDAEGSNRLVGTFAGTTVPGSDASKYYFGLSANTGKYVKVSSDVALKPFRAYIECEKASGNAAGLRHRIEGEDLNETAIAEVVETLNDSEAQYFDMNGRKMNGLQKGLNIISKNGKKVKVLVK